MNEKRAFDIDSMSVGEGTTETPLSYLDRRIERALDEVQRLRDLKQTLAFTEYDHRARSAVYSLLVDAERNREGDRPSFRLIG